MSLTVKDSALTSPADIEAKVFSTVAVCGYKIPEALSK